MSAINTGDYKTVATLETFSFLPAFTTEQLHQQIAYIIKSGWSPSIEHVHPSKSMNIYWDQWKIPFFGEKDLNVVLSELEAAHKVKLLPPANPPKVNVVMPVPKPRPPALLTVTVLSCTAAALFNSSVPPLIVVAPT